MGETDVHRDEMADTIDILKDRYRDVAHVYVAGNLFVYYEEGDPGSRFAPDVFVIFGVPKRRRRIYKLWEEKRPPSFVLEAGQSIGFPGVAMNRGLGLLLLACTLIYIVPQTSVLGAILITAYLGGAVATHVRLGHPLFSHVLFGVYVGILMWGGLALRLPSLMAILRFK